MVAAAVIACVGALVALLLFARWLIGLVVGSERRASAAERERDGLTRDLAERDASLATSNAALVAERSAHAETLSRYQRLVADAVKSASDADLVELAGGGPAPPDAGGVPMPVADTSGPAGFATTLR